MTNMFFPKTRRLKVKNDRLVLGHFFNAITNPLAPDP